MKFQKFPFLVQEKILEDLAYADLFGLSLLSTRTARIIRCLKFVRVSRVLYGQTPHGFDISVEEHQDNNWFPVGAVEIKRSRNFRYRCITKLGGSKINFECQKNEDISCPFKNLLFCRDDPEKRIPKLMVEHANSLFGQPPDVYLNVNFDATFDLTPIVPSVTELEFVSKRKINGKGVEFIKNNYNLKYLSIEGQWSVEPDFRDIPYLKIENSDHWANAILRSYKGKNLELDHAEIGKEEILEFVRTWMNNVGYHNIECVQIELKDEIYDAEGAMEEIESADWNPNQRPAIYEYCNPAYHKRQLAAFMFQDIHRNGDNQLASFYIEPKHFSFVVWK